jgi:pilus assembly protein CpaB
MRRGRIFIYLALIIIVIIAAVGIYLVKNRVPTSSSQKTTLVPTPQGQLVQIITAGQNIYPGTPITAAMLSSIQIPEDALVQGEFTNKADLVSMYAKYTISQNVPITSAMVTSKAGNIYLPGSSWAPFIPQGMTAVAIPATRLSMAGYGIRDGDYVDVIVSMLVVDIDPAYQTILPNVTAGVISANSQSLLIGSGSGTSASTSLASGQIVNLTAQVAAGGSGAPEGRVEYNNELQQPFYVVPSETQRPRQVTQMIMQNVQVLHVGTFPLTEEASTTSQASSTTATPAPVAGTTTTTTTAATIERPDIITLMVAPQDAVTLTYLVFSGAQITLTLRNPNDTTAITQPQAATLEYLLTQYNIPVPPKLPYGLEPRVDALVQPTLPNDPTTGSAAVK